MIEEALPGGFVNAVVRVGETVHRSAGPWTPAVHALLRHLETAGFAESPRVHGLDQKGREVLDYIEGEAVGWTDWPAVMLEGDGLIQLGELLRRYHDAVRSFRPPLDATWRNLLAPSSDELVRHGDFSPFNTIWRDGQVVGVIDWDFAQPGAAISDLAYLAWYAVPLRNDRSTAEHGFAGGADRRLRLRVLCEAYGRGDPTVVVDEAVRIIERERTDTAELARRGIHPWTRFGTPGGLQAFAAEADWIREHRDLLV